MITVNKQEYILSDELFIKAPVYCKLCRSARELIRKKKLTEYIFCKLINNKWIVSDGKSYKFDKVFFKKTFIDTIPEINEEKIIIDDDMITVNKQEYILSDDLFNKAPVYCKLCRSARELIRKKKLTEYIFCKLINNKWIVSDGKSYKFDKVFFKKTFIDTIPEINEDKIIMDDDKIELAPNIIHLDESEKFRDDIGETLDIETRGERKVDGIYFKVKDVMVGFKMDNLLTTIIHTIKSGYIEGIHYKYFNCLKVRKIIDNRIKIKKELFLTYSGFQRVIFRSYHKCINNNSYIMQKWLDNFDKVVLNNYKININDNLIQNNIGMASIRHALHV